MAHYIALVDGEAGRYGVAFPDAPGCTAMGESVEQALRNAIGALADWMDDENPRPEARTVEALRNDAEVKEQLAAGSFFAVVPLLLDQGRSVRANLSIDAGLLEAIDDAASKVGLTRSAFLSSAAREKILSSV